MRHSEVKVAHCRPRAYSDSVPAVHFGPPRFTCNGWESGVAMESLAGWLLPAVIIVGIAVVLWMRRQRSQDEAEAARAYDLGALTRLGWRVEHESEAQTVLVRGHRVNHLLHVVLSVLTLGLWLIVWLFVTLNGGERRMVIHKPKAKRA